MRAILRLPATAFLAGCTAIGGGTGAVTTPAGAPAGLAKLAYETRGGAVARLTVTLPDGEVFQGSAVSGSRAVGPGLILGGDEVLVIAPGRDWTGEIAASLRAAGGLTMDCALREKRVGLGLEGGALGTCTVSDGRRAQVDL